MYHFINARGITNALRGVWHSAYGLARCPAHDDQVPSLSLCSFKETIAELYLRKRGITCNLPP
nr:hypothetical protein [Bartonella machadoae]